MEGKEAVLPVDPAMIIRYQPYQRVLREGQDFLPQSSRNQYFAIGTAVMTEQCLDSGPDGGRGGSGVYGRYLSSW